MVDIETWRRHVARESVAQGMTEADRLAALNSVQGEEDDLNKAIAEHEEHRREPAGPTREEEEAFAEAHDVDEGADEIRRANQEYYNQWEVDSDGNHYPREWSPDDRLNYQDFDDGMSVSSAQDNRDAKDALDQQEYQEQQDRDQTAAEHRERQERDRGGPTLEEEQAFAEAHRLPLHEGEVQKGIKRSADDLHDEGAQQPKRTRILGRNPAQQEPSQAAAAVSMADHTPRSNAADPATLANGSPERSGQQSPRNFDRPSRSERGISR
ncbi:hypothetical protein [Agrobacterium vitis]|uniref:hypothetical protein n=1 Tax=Agrobacterium vitis TaxID=373 RepID=UPI0015735D18|nr:hypothetical protein [Agrobacterium vitis]NSZ19507.1 hypothetical protein [Agrobacterium vitis]QZO06821.1 hypothetical protein K4831_22090 [Agrobacterium vitis]UJL91553.1 hypothetical protein AVF2S5_26610 [Agrobacterium vitis]